MSNQINLETLMQALSTPLFSPSPGSRLVIAAEPTPFIAPKISTESIDFSKCDVLFVRASAAVGKTTVARMISSQMDIPLLDLSKVSMGAGGVSGLLDGLLGEGDARSAFHAGLLPVIVDALDEGRLINPVKSFEEFFVDTARFIASVPANIASKGPKLVCFGRFEAVDEVSFYFAATESEVRIATVDISLFDEYGARELLKRYADVNSTTGSAWMNQVRERDGIVSMFFAEIASALGIDPDRLWHSASGAAFAGYAPILQAVGILLATVRPTFDSFKKRIAMRQSTEAWDVIERVLNVILDREQMEKVVDPLTQVFRANGLLGAGVDLPDALFNRREQLWFLLQLVDGIEVDNLTTLIDESQIQNVFLAPWSAVRETYLRSIRSFIREHPFFIAAHRTFSNDVVASICLADAVLNSWPMKTMSDSIIARLSRLPFLWRSLKPRLTASSVIAGSTAAYVLNSYWNDPLTKSGDRGRVEIKVEPDNESAAASIPVDRRQSVVFQIDLPISFYSQISDCEVICQSQDVTLVGYKENGTSGAAASRGAFFIRGAVLLECGQLFVEADEVSIDGGEIWLEAAEFQLTNQIEISPKDGSEFGWGGVLKSRYPWNKYPGNISKPSLAADAIVSIIEKCREKLSAVPSVVLFADYSVPANDPLMSWAKNFGSRWQMLAKILADHNLVSKKQIPASGSVAKYQMSFDVNWDDIINALKSVDEKVLDPQMASIVSELRNHLR